MPSCRQRRAVRGDGGFTLIELLITIAILAIALTIGVRLGDALGPETELDTAARLFASAIEDARSEAVITGSVVFLEIELGERRDSAQSWRTIREPLPGHEDEAEDDEQWRVVRDWTPLPRGARIDAVAMGDEEPFVEGRVNIALQPDGTMPSFLVRFWAPELKPDRNHDEGWACVQVAGLLGQPRVLSRYVEPEILRDEDF